MRRVSILLMNTANIEKIFCLARRVGRKKVGQIFFLFRFLFFRETFYCPWEFGSTSLSITLIKPWNIKPWNTSTISRQLFSIWLFYFININCFQSDLFYLFNRTPECAGNSFGRVSNARPENNCLSKHGQWCGRVGKGECLGGEEFPLFLASICTFEKQIHLHFLRIFF